MSNFSTDVMLNLVWHLRLYQNETLKYLSGCASQTGIQGDINIHDL
jgi:hypothetical protein